MANGNIITGNLEQNFRAAMGVTKRPINPQDFGPDINSIRSSAFEDGRKSATDQLMRSGKQTNSFATSSVSNTGIGMAKVASSGIVYTQPQFFSPIHTPINWQIPSKRKECYQWSFVSGCELMTCDFFNKPIEDVVAGNTLVTHDGTVQTVDKTTSRYVDTELFSVKFDGNYRGFSVTSGHKVYIIKREDVLCKYSHGEGTDRYCDRNHRHYMCTRTECHQDASKALVPVLTKVEDIKEGDFLYTPIPNQNINGEVTTVEQARMLGYYCAEGCRADSYSVILTFNETETEYIDEVARLAKVICRDLKGIRLQPHPNNHSCDIVIKSKELTAYCNRHCSGRAREKTLSKDIVNANPELQLQFLAAYWNGDGCQSFAKGSGGNVSFRTASKRLAEQLVVVLSRCNYPSRIYYAKTARNPNNLIGRHSTREFFDCYTVTVAPSNGGELFNIGPPVRCGQSGRKPSVRLMDGKVLHRITSVESERYRGIVYDVRVPGNYSVICNGVAVAQCRYFYENEPKVAQAIEFHSKFPVNRFSNECSNRYVKRYFDKLSEKLNLIKWLRVISHEVHLLGDCFPFLEVECQKCGGRGFDNHGKVCEHEGGSFKRLVILNPECAEVYSDPISPESLIAFLPNDELRTLISKRGPGYERFSKDVVKMIMAGVPIPLDNRNVSHIKYCDNGYNKYGIGMVRRLFPILAYKTKLMTAQWIIAERLILPIKVAKVGSDERPASAGDLADINSKLAQVANDPNLTLVTHHAFELDWFGAAGKIMQLTNEFEIISQEILDGMGVNKVLLNGEGPTYCISDCSRILCEDGLKYRWELDTTKHRIATFNSKTGCLEYQFATKKYEYDWDSVSGNNPNLKWFKTGKIDMLVTPNHKMLQQERKYDNKNENDVYEPWGTVEAKDVKNRSRFRACVDWAGEKPLVEGYCDIPTEDFLQMAGWFASEGWADGYKVCIAQSQTANPDNVAKMLNILSRYGFKYYGNKQFSTTNHTLAKFLSDNFGAGSQNKKIPHFIKNLNQDCLKILLKSLVDGDGSVRPNTKKKLTSSKYIAYTTTSPHLRDDIMEICLKLGFAPTMRSQPLRVSEIIVNGKKKTICSKLPQWVVCWSDSQVGKFPTLASRDVTKKPAPNKQTIFDVPYQGKVWCVDVPNHFIITERNGKIGIHGNSSAAIGVEVMIDKLDAWRRELSDWVEQRIYLQVAKMMGFIEKNEWGEHEYVYPKIKWDIMHLRDQQQMRTFMLQLHEKGAISTQTMLKSFDIDYNQEVELLRYERAKGAMGGAQQGGEGGIGGGFGGGGGGLPDMGGMPGGDEGGGLADLGMGDAGGAPGGDAGGMGAAASSSTANIGNFGGKVLKKKSREKISKYKDHLFNRKQDEKSGYIRDGSGRICFTGPERELMRDLSASVKRGEIRHNIQTQFEVNAMGHHYSIDFAMPDIKLGIEVDGALFHSTEEQIHSDQQRDEKLAQLGWTILRFTDKEVENRTREIIEEIIRRIIQKENWMKKSAE